MLVVTPVYSWRVQTADNKQNQPLLLISGAPNRNGVFGIAFTQLLDGILRVHASASSYSGVRSPVFSESPARYRPHGYRAYPALSTRAREAIERGFGRGVTALAF